MARLDEKDPRWIVENREDGKNVNNWHWVEMDHSQWAREQFKEALQGLKLDTEKIMAKTTTVSTTGEVSVNTRKQKTILFYELDVTIKWEGELIDQDVEAKGTIQMPYISEENDVDDFEILVSVDDENENKRTIKDEVRKRIIPILKEKVPKILTDLRQATQQKTKMPVKQQNFAKLEQLEAQTPAPAPNTPQTTPATTPTATTATTATAATATSGAAAGTATTPTQPAKKSTALRTGRFELTEKFMCTPHDLFMCLVETNRVKAYAGSDAVASVQKNGLFSLFGGNVVGENLEVDVPKKLVQKWRFSSWPEGHYSTVTMTLEEKDSKTVLKLVHEGVPDGEIEQTKSGWSSNFWSRIKGVFGYGSGMSF